MCRKKGETIGRTKICRGKETPTPAEVNWDNVRSYCIRNSQTLAAPAPIGNYFALYDPTTSKVAGMLSQWLAKEGPKRVAVYDPGGAGDFGEGERRRKYQD